MKNFFYSPYTKAIAAILFVICIVSGVLIVTDGIGQFYSDGEMVYGFERDFSECRYFHSLLAAPESVLFNAYIKMYSDEDERLQGATQNVPAESLESLIEGGLEDLYCLDKIDYYIEWNGRVFTNCGAKSARDLTDARFYSLGVKDEYGGVTYDQFPDFSYLNEIARYDETGSITVCTSIKEAYAETCAGLWERQARVVNDTFSKILILAVLALILLIYLIGVSGKNKDGAHTSLWTDAIWTEVHLALIGGFGIGAIVLCLALFDEHVSGHFPQNMLYPVVGLSAALASAVMLTSFLSIIRNIKRGRFVESCIVLRILRWLWRTFLKVLRWIYMKCKTYKAALFKALSKKEGVLLIGGLLVYTAVIGFCGIFTFTAPLFFLFAVALFGFAAFVLGRRMGDLDEIKKGVGEVRSGNLSYKIPELKSEDLKPLAANINEIALGLDASVSAKLKAERLKTELITNVSHDLKTPLTSIISYTELLSKAEGLPEEASDYVKIIAQKSDRLKQLTEDLFAVSKVQSGSEPIVLEKLDFSLLINQSLGEHDSEIQKSSLTFVVDSPKELYISADGRKMSRVLGNLLSNILKYSLPGTRVFITASGEGDEAALELKNIASYPMEFDAEEITGRFVRGEQSRTAEGNGLGLAIAKSYTEACGGKFQVIIDGDMFKVIIRFKKY